MALNGIQGEERSILGIWVQMADLRAGYCEVLNSLPRLALLQVVDARDGEGGGLPGALGDPADHLQCVRVAPRTLEVITVRAI